MDIFNKCLARMRALGSTSRAVPDEVIAAVLIGVLIAFFIALQQRRSHQHRLSITTEFIEDGQVQDDVEVGWRFFLVVTAMAAVAVYVVIRTMRSDATVVVHNKKLESPSMSPRGIDRAMETAFDEAAMMRHIHRNDPGF